MPGRSLSKAGNFFASYLGYAMRCLLHTCGDTFIIPSASYTISPATMVVDTFVCSSASVSTTNGSRSSTTRSAHRPTARVPVCDSSPDANAAPLVYAAAAGNGGVQPGQDAGSLHRRVGPEREVRPGLAQRPPGIGEAAAGPPVLVGDLPVGAGMDGLHRGDDVGVRQARDV